MDSKVRIYDIDSQDGFKEKKVLDLEPMQVYKIDYHPTKEQLLYGTLTLNTFGKLVGWGFWFAYVTFRY